MAEVPKIEGRRYDLRIAVVGLARDCEKTLPSDVARLSRALAGMKSVNWIIIESDSQDKTVEKLRELKRKIPDFDYKSILNLSKTLPDRTGRLAHCRNLYLKELEENSALATIDYVVVADFDGVNKGVSRKSIESCFVRDDWDACFSNQLGPYYDVWALRHPLWSPNDCWEQFRFFDQVSGPSSANRRRSVYARMIRIKPTADWIRVSSAFGGLGIYRASTLRGFRYSGTDHDSAIACEHVFLNTSLSDAGFRLFINPQMINARYTEHSFRSTWVGQIFVTVIELWQKRYVKDARPLDST